MGQDLFGGSARRLLDRTAAAMRALHRMLIRVTQLEYERAHGRVENPYALLALVANDPAFAWLQPMTRLIVEIEDLLGRKEAPPSQAELAGTRASIERLLVTEGAPFSTRYLALIQAQPDVAVEDGRLHAVLKELPAP